MRRTRLKLGAGHRHGILDALKVAAPDGQGRLGPAIAPHDLGSHRLQRTEDTVHGPGAQGGVAGDDAKEGLACQEARDQAYGGAGVACVEHLLGLLKPLQSVAMDGEQVTGGVAVFRRLPLNSGSQSLHTRQHGGAVIAQAEVSDRGGPLSDAVQEHGPVGDRLVPRWREAPL